MSANLPHHIPTFLLLLVKAFNRFEQKNLQLSLIDPISRRFITTQRKFLSAAAFLLSQQGRKQNGEQAWGEGRLFF